MLTRGEICLEFLLLDATWVLHTGNSVDHIHGSGGGGREKEREVRFEKGATLVPSLNSAAAAGGGGGGRPGAPGGPVASWSSCLLVLLHEFL